MTADDWVILVEHMIDSLVGPLDGLCIQLLALEGELRERGIETAFLPYRPGEAPGYTRFLAQPVQLMVRGQDLELALEIAGGPEMESADCGELEFTEPADGTDARNAGAWSESTARGAHRPKAL